MLLIREVGAKSLCELKATTQVSEREFPFIKRWQCCRIDTLWRDCVLKISSFYFSFSRRVHVSVGRLIESVLSVPSNRSNRTFSRAKLLFISICGSMTGHGHMESAINKCQWAVCSGKFPQRRFDAKKNREKSARLTFARKNPRLQLRSQ